MIMSPVASRRRQRMTQKIERVVQVDVGQERRDHRALPCPLVTDRHDPVFQNARLEPLADQADDTSSARSRKDSGMLRRSALAVVRLMTSSNLVGCSIAGAERISL